MCAGDEMYSTATSLVRLVIPPGDCFTSPKIASLYRSLVVLEERTVQH